MRRVIFFLAIAGVALPAYGQRAADIEAFNGDGDGVRAAMGDFSATDRNAVLESAIKRADDDRGLNDVARRDAARLHVSDGLGD